MPRIFRPGGVVGQPRNQIPRLKGEFSGATLVYVPSVSLLHALPYRGDVAAGAGAGVAPTYGYTRNGVTARINDSTVTFPGTQGLAFEGGMTVLTVGSYYSATGAEINNMVSREAGSTAGGFTVDLYNRFGGTPARIYSAYNKPGVGDTNWDSVWVGLENGTSVKDATGNGSYDTAVDTRYTVAATTATGPAASGVTDIDIGTVAAWPSKVEVELVVIWPRKFTEQQLRRISANPYCIFQAPRQAVLAESSAVATEAGARIGVRGPKFSKVDGPTWRRMGIDAGGAADAITAGAASAASQASGGYAGVLTGVAQAAAQAAGGQTQVVLGAAQAASQAARGPTVVVLGGAQAASQASGAVLTVVGGQGQGPNQAASGSTVVTAGGAQSAGQAAGAVVETVAGAAQAASQADGKTNIHAAGAAQAASQASGSSVAVVAGAASSAGQAAGAGTTGTTLIAAGAAQSASQAVGNVTQVSAGGAQSASQATGGVVAVSAGVGQSAGQAAGEGSTGGTTIVAGGAAQAASQAASGPIVVAAGVGATHPQTVASMVIVVAGVSASGGQSAGGGGEVAPVSVVLGAWTSNRTRLQSGTRSNVQTRVR